MSTKRLLLLGVAGIIAIASVVVIGAYSYRRVHPSQKIYGQVGSYVATQNEVDSLTKSYNLINRDKAIDTLLELNLYRQSASSLGIKVSSADIQKELQKRTGKADPYGRVYLLAAIESDMLKNQLTVRISGNTQGRMVVINFNQHLPYADFNVLQPGEVESKHSQYIAADRVTADALKDLIYGKLKSKSVTFDQAMQMERDDPKIGVKSLPTSVHSDSFNTADTANGLGEMVNVPQLAKLIQETKTGTFSEPQVLQVSTGPSDTAPKADGLWVIINVDQRLAKVASNFSDFVSAQKTKLKYRKLI